MMANPKYDQRAGILTEEAGAPDAFDPGLTKAEASKRIDEMQRRVGRGK
jgi:Protein of unknown function (DUF3072)